eukprot:364312-Chlamydomonas_euryale.AAC.2
MESCVRAFHAGKSANTFSPTVMDVHPGWVGCVVFCGCALGLGGVQCRGWVGYSVGASGLGAGWSAVLELQALGLGGVQCWGFGPWGWLQCSVGASGPWAGWSAVLGLRAVGLVAVQCWGFGPWGWLECSVGAWSPGSGSSAALKFQRVGRGGRLTRKSGRRQDSLCRQPVSLADGKTPSAVDP